MSKTSEEQVEYISKEEVVEWLKDEIAKLERRLKALKTILALLETSRDYVIGERVEDVKVGKKKLARIHLGEDYVRLVFETPVALPSEIREYLSSVEEDLRTLQVRSGFEGELAKVSYKEKPEGTIIEVRIDNLQSTIELIKARAALKYAAEATHQLLKAMSKESSES
ncbi:MAG: hypothetical protein QXG64_07805 [Acidilobaceae archaeon]